MPLEVRSFEKFLITFGTAKGPVLSIMSLGMIGKVDFLKKFFLTDLAFELGRFVMHLSVRKERRYGGEILLTILAFEQSRRVVYLGSRHALAIIVTVL